MKANSRRRVLISSLAMLLVAIVALGTATYAWFTSSTSATADGINVQTTKSSELKISKSDLDWQDSITYDGTKTLRPATSANGSTWYKNEADAKTSYASTKTAVAVQDGEMGNYVFVDMLNIKNNGESTCNDVTITVSAGTMSAFARMAIVPCDAQTEAGKMPTITTDNFKANIYGLAANDSWKPWNGTAYETTAYTTTAAASGAEIEVGDMAAGAVASYKIIVWFEGEDADCYDLTETTLKAPNISFTVAGSSDVA